MTQKEKKNRVRILFQQLKLITTERDAIEKQLGRRNVIEKIDEILDEINDLKKDIQED